MNPNISDGAKAFLETGIRGGGLVSDGPVSDTFERGWALHPFACGRAHWWVRNGATWDRDGKNETVAYLSACGLSRHTTERAPLLLPGNWTTCERCDAKLLRKPKTSEVRS